MNDYWFMYIILVVYIFAITYYIYMFFVIQLYKNKQNYRCNPLVMLAGAVNGFENTATEFKTCIQDIQPMIYSEIINGYNTMLTDMNQVTDELKTENDAFLKQLNADYDAKNADLKKNVTALNRDKELMNKKITTTNDAILSSLDKINTLV